MQKLPCSLLAGDGIRVSRGPWRRSFSLGDQATGPWAMGLSWQGAQGASCVQTGRVPEAGSQDGPGGEGLWCSFSSCCEKWGELEVVPGKKVCDFPPLPQEKSFCESWGVVKAASDGAVVSREALLSCTQDRCPYAVRSSHYKIHFVLSAASTPKGQPGQGKCPPQAESVVRHHTQARNPSEKPRGAGGSSATCPHTQRHMWPPPNSRENSNQTTKPRPYHGPPTAGFRVLGVPGPSSRPAGPRCSLTPLPGPAGHHS